MFRIFICLATALLPWSLRRRVLAAFFAWELADDSWIGIAAISADRVRLASGSRIGHLTVCWGLGSLVLGPSALIGKGNWIAAHPRGGSSFSDTRVPELVLEQGAAITGRHLIDCTDRVHIGRFATLAGWQSQILTHAVDVRANRQSCAPVLIGEYSFVGSRVILLPGARVAPRSVVAAGAVVTTALDDELEKYAGVPARRVGSLTGDELYFSRKTGPVV